MKKRLGFLWVYLCLGAFLVAGTHNTVLGASPLMKNQARQDELGEIVGTVTQAFLGLTVQCARCHNHKTDPISTAAYYSMAGRFAGVWHGACGAGSAWSGQLPRRQAHGTPKNAGNPGTSRS